MPTSSLPLDVKESLTRYIDSVNQLEVLFLLYERHDKIWDADSVCRELRSNVTSSRIQLAYLHRCGFISSIEENKYQFHSSSPLFAITKRLHDVYLEKSVAVISYIYEKPQNKLKEFADAFKIKKDS